MLVRGKKIGGRLLAVVLLPQPQVPPVLVVAEVSVAVVVLLEVLVDVPEELVSSGLIKVPPSTCSGEKEVRLKSRVVFTPWKKTGFPAAVNARPERIPSSLPVSPPLGTPVVGSRRPAVGVKRELTVTPLDVSSLSV